MPNPSEARVLRDELARAMAEVTKRDAALERQRAQPGGGGRRLSS